MTMAAGASAYSAKPFAVIVMTRSPGFTFVTPSPTASTVPATSRPGVCGKGGLTWYLPSATSEST